MYDKDKQLKEKRLQKGPLKKDEQSQTLTITREHEIKSLGAYEKTVNPMLSPEQGVDIETLLETDYYNDPVLVSDPMQEMLAFLAQTDLIVSTDPTTQKKSYSLSETDSEKLKQIQGQLKSFALRGG